MRFQLKTRNSGNHETREELQEHLEITSGKKFTNVSDQQAGIRKLTRRGWFYHIPCKACGHV